jgi:hypothetical protein
MALKLETKVLHIAFLFLFSINYSTSEEWSLVLALTSDLSPLCRCVVMS